MTSQDIKKTIVDKWMPLFFGKTKYREEPMCWLCQLVNAWEGTCLACVICRETKQRGCYGTPYMDWRENPCRETAREELLFLLGLYRKTRKGEIK